MKQDIHELFDALWTDYLNMTPSALKIHRLLGRGEIVNNDHVAFRTFNHPKIGLQQLAQHFENLGYVQKGSYYFEQKKLNARHYEHTDPSVPKVFISELMLEQCTEKLHRIVSGLIEQVDESHCQSAMFLYGGAPWRISSQDYQTLLQESEYAAWLAAFGFRANHFTVDVNRLSHFDNLQEVNRELKAAGFLLNTSGGEIKGSPEVLLEQSSVLADLTEVQFIDETKSIIPGCFYEFAKRYPKPNGELYGGFVAASADKLFESTNTI